MPAQDDYDEGEIRGRLEPWFAERLGGPVEIVSIEAPGESGFSSETLLVELHHEGGAESLVVKTRPLGFQLFPTYDLEMQFRCMQAVGEHSDVPVPAVRWFEHDEGLLGREFFVMERVDGEVPTDSPPYTIWGFMYEASPEQQERAYRSGIEVLARLHDIDPLTSGLDFLDRRSEGATGLEQQMAYYERFIGHATGGRGHPVLDPAARWIREHVPEGLEERLSWGDARLGNLMFRDFEPVAVLDWEMASLGPREVDLAWYVFFVRFFSEHLGLPNLEGFPSEAEGLAHYEELSGHELQSFDWFLTWAAFRWSVIWVRLMPTKQADLPAEWTLVDNPPTRSLAELIGLPDPATLDAQA